MSRAHLRIAAVVFLLCLSRYLAVCPALLADEQDRLQVGVQSDGRIVVPTNQILRPAGKQITFPGRPVDLAFADDGQTLVVKNLRDLVFINVATAKITQTLRIPRQGNSQVGFSVVGLLVDGDRIYASDAVNRVRLALRQANGRYRWSKDITLAQPKVGGAAHPAGIAAADEDEIWVASTRGNSIQRISATSGQVLPSLPVGVAPYMICSSRAGHREGRFRAEGLTPGMKISLNASSDKKYFQLAGTTELSVDAGETKDLGDLKVKPD